MKERIKWLDVLKFIGILEIYFGHFGAAGLGLGHLFVFSHHVQLFFFAAGCSYAIASPKTLKENFIQKVRSLLVPFYLFSIISLTVHVLMKNLRFSLGGVIVLNFTAILKGNIRNAFVGYSLWFISCIFVIAVMYPLIQKAFKNNKPLLLIVSIALSYISRRYIGPPKWIYNIDSALSFLPFYTIGYITFPYINNILNDRRKKTRILVLSTGLISLLFAALLYFGKNIINTALVSTFGNSYPVQFFSGLFTPFAVIWVLIVAAYYFRDAELFNSIGSNVLYLCLSETVVKNITGQTLALVSLTFSLTNQLQALVYSFVLIYLTNRYVVPREKKLINKVNRSISYFLKPDKEEAFTKSKGINKRKAH